MRIDPAAALHSALLGVLKGGGKSGEGQAAFRPDPAPVGASPAPSAAAQPSATGSVAMLVALAAQAPGLHRTPALRRAERGLESLGRLHRALLAGAAPADALQQLREWKADAEDSQGDIAELLREVELRILVELAKAER